MLTLPSCMLAFAADFSVSRVMVQGSLSMHRKTSTLVRGLSHRRWRPFARSALFVAYGLPFALLVGWASALYPYEPTRCWVYGLGVVLAGLAFLLSVYAIGMWAKRAWHVSARILLAGAICGGQLAPSQTLFTRPAEGGAKSDYRGPTTKSGQPD